MHYSSYRALFSPGGHLHTRQSLSSKMSWMDSWSRPGKHAAVPPPFYLTQGDDVPYCRTCGRVISESDKLESRMAC
jgi:hypothetical protein